MNYHINNKNLWNWLDNSSRIEFQLKAISNLIRDKSFIVDESYYAHSDSKSSKIIEQLSLCIPRKYFLELQYCSKAYATFFSKIFPGLASLVDELLYIEWLLYVEPDTPKYRDHLVHMFKVAFVQDIFLQNSNLLNKIMKLQFESPPEHFSKWLSENKYNIENWTDEDRREIILIASLIAALFHDFGYGYYYLNDYKQRLFKLYPWLLPDVTQIDSNATFSKHILRGLPAAFIEHHHNWILYSGNLIKEDQKKILVAGFFRDCLPLNHSIASTFFIMHIAESLKTARAISEKLYVAFNLAAESVMLHDMTKQKRSLHLECGGKNGNLLGSNSCETTPLATLLILSDEVAVWERPRVKHTTTKDSVTYKLDEKNMLENIKISFSNNKIELKPNYKNIDELAEKTDFKKELYKALDFAVPEEGENPQILGFDIIVTEVVPKIRTV